MSIGKIITLGAWLFALSSFVVEMPAPAQAFGRGLACFLLVAHIVECGIFFSVLKRAGGSLRNHLLQTIIFGLFHVRELRGTAAQTGGDA